MSFDSIEAILKRAMGLDATSIGRSSIERAVRRRMANSDCARVDEYVGRLSSSASELQQLIEGVAVPETWFNRDSRALAAMVRLAQRVLEQHETRRVRVLSLPCSTGEEPYSVAMAVEEAGLDPERFRIDAVDISQQGLVKARAGVYGRNSFRGSHQSFRQRHFAARGERYEVAERLRRRVRFCHGNLLEVETLPGLGCYDFVLCRNLLIYFDGPTREKAVSVLDRLLAEDGVLFVGPAESSLLLSMGFASAGIPLAAAFRRGDSARSAGEPEARWARPAQPRRDAPRVAFSSTSARPALSARGPATFPAVPPRAEPGEPSLEAAMGLADQGRYREATELCEKHLRQAGPSGRAFYLLGLIEDAADRPDEAQAYYRKAVYLEPGHAETLMQLAHHARRRGDDAAAERYQRRARRPRDKVAR